jgi:hypothetical protein
MPDYVTGLALTPDRTQVKPPLCPVFKILALHWLRSLLPFDNARDNGQVLSAEPLVNSLLPFVSQARQDVEPVVTVGLEGEAHVLERERQRELGRVLAVGDPAQLGCLPRRWCSSGPRPTAAVVGEAVRRAVAGC